MRAHATCTTHAPAHVQLVHPSAPDARPVPAYVWLVPAKALRILQGLFDRLRKHKGDAECFATLLTKLRRGPISMPDTVTYTWPGEAPPPLGIAPPFSLATPTSLKQQLIPQPAPMASPFQAYSHRPLSLGFVLIDDEISPPTSPCGGSTHPTPLPQPSHPSSCDPGAGPPHLHQGILAPERLQAACCYVQRRSGPR
eukprot:gene25923-11600_t